MDQQIPEEERKPFEPPLGPEEHLEVFIYGHHTKAPSCQLIHAFGIRYDRLPKGPSELFLFVSDKSKEGGNTKSTRGLLGALLTVARRVESNEAQTQVLGIYSDQEYITRHLPGRIEKWCGDRANPNRDLLQKLLPYSWVKEKLTDLRDQKHDVPVTSGQAERPPFGFVFKISHGIPIPDEARRLGALEALKDIVKDHLEDYVRKNYR